LNDTEVSGGNVAAVALDVFPQFLQLEARYTDGYRAAKSIVGFGNSIKIIGAGVGFIIAVGFFGLNIGGSTGSIVGLLFGGLVWLGFFVCGVIISAQGQMLLAVLDSAVHTSPFLNNSLRASIMSLKK
jgi:hypothetical protein